VAKLIKETEWTGPLAILVSALLWSISGLLIKYVPWHPMAIASGRSLLAAVVLLVYFRRRLQVRLNWLTLLSALSLTLTQCLFVVANKLTTAANAIMLQYTMPIFIVIISAALYKIRPARREILVMVWAMAGIVLFFLDNLAPGNLTGNLLSVLSGITFALFYVLNTRPACQVPQAMFLGQIGTALAGLPFLATLQLSTISWTPLLAMAILGIVQLGLAFVIFQYGIRRTTPLNASLISMAEPIMNPVWVFLLLGERPGLLALVGAAVVISAMIFLNVSQIRQKQDTTV
jgi:drug/metabolite transporter (DMT)-like permease